MLCLRQTDLPRSPRSSQTPPPRCAGTSILRKRRESFHPCGAADPDVRPSNGLSFCSENTCFPCAIDRRDFSVSRHCLLKKKTDAVAVVAAEDPPRVSRCCTRGENQRSFRAACLSSWACAQVRLRCAIMAMKEATASVSLTPSSPICATHLAAIVSSRGGQCSLRRPTSCPAVHSSSGHQLSCQLFKWSEDHPGWTSRTERCLCVRLIASSTLERSCTC